MGEVGEVGGVDECLLRAMSIPGALSATLVDCTSGLVIGTVGGEGLVDRDAGAAGATDFIRSVISNPALSSTPAGDDIESVIISSTAGYHVFVLISTAFDGQLFLHMWLDPKLGNIALARHHIQSIIRELVAP